MRKLLCVFFALTLLMWAGVWMGAALAVEKEPVTSARQLNHPDYTVGVSSNSAAFMAVNRDLPNATLRYVEGVDGYMAVQQGRIDAYAFARRQMELAIASGLKGVSLLPENIGETVKIAVGISPASKIAGLKDKVNRFISELRADGTLEAMYRRWVVDGDRRMPEIELPASPNFRLRVGTVGVFPPYSYYEGSVLTGYDIELARRFAAWLGAGIEFKIYDFGGLIAAAATGDIDCIMSNLNITPERAERIPFSDVLYTEDVALMVRDASAAGPRNNGVYTAISQLNGRRVAVGTGSIWDGIVQKRLPSADILYLDNLANVVTALLDGKTDAFATDEPVAMAIMSVNDHLTCIPEYLNRYENAFFVAKDGNAALLDELNGFIRQLRDDGVLAEMQKIWFGSDESKKTVAHYEMFPAPNGTLSLAQDGDNPPFVYVRDGRIVGYDIDILARFCEARGYGLEPVTMNFAALIPAVHSGRCDIGGGNVTITAERSESVTFTEPIYSGGGVMIVRDTGNAEPANEGVYTTLAQMDGRRIGVQTGSTFDAIVLARLPKAQISYFNSYPDMAAAMEAGRIDGFPGDEPVLRMMAAEDGQLTILDEYMETFDFGFVLPKTEAGERLRDELDAYIASIQESGELKAVTDKWTGADEAAKTLPDYASFPAPNGVLTLATEGAYPPMTYFREGKVVGLEIDLAARFCEANGYGLKVESMNFDALLPAVQSGRCNFAVAGLTITEERKESVNFSRPYYSGGTVMAVLKDKDKGVAAVPGQEDDFLSDIRSSFDRTFLRESRWRLFVEGGGVTLLITALSILFGTALGFGVFLLCRGGNPLANTVTRFCVWLVQGTPMVVLLMILYYIVFSGVDISGVAVAVVAFTITFGAAVYGMLRIGVGAVDRGQTEAAYALGYGSQRTFFRIILPQALPHIMPSYQSEVVALVKATAIVGYIAVQDLTKMGDIVRSRTYEAFFPLIAVAILYFIMAGCFNFLINRVQAQLNPRRRRREDVLKRLKSWTSAPKGE